MGSNGWEATDGKQRMGSNGWEATDGKQRMGSNGWGATDGKQRVGSNGWGATDGKQRVGSNGWGATDGKQRVGSNGLEATDGNATRSDPRSRTVYDDVGLQAGEEEALDDRLPPLLLRHPAQLERSPLLCRRHALQTDEETAHTTTPRYSIGSPSHTQPGMKSTGVGILLVGIHWGWDPQGLGSTGVGIRKGWDPRGWDRRKAHSATPKMVVFTAHANASRRSVGRVQYRRSGRAEER